MPGLRVDSKVSSGLCRRVPIGPGREGRGRAERGPTEPPCRARRRLPFDKQAEADLAAVFRAPADPMMHAKHVVGLSGLWQPSGRAASLGCFGYGT